MTTPACPYFGVCGGCQNQHITYEQQVENKRQRLQYLLQQHYQGTITAHTGESYGYRNRMDFIIGPNTVGFRTQDPKKLVDVVLCPISEPRLNTLLAEVRTWLAKAKIEPYDARRKTGTFKYAVIRIADTTTISFMLNEDSSQLSKAVDAIKLFAPTSTADNICIAYTTNQQDESVSLESYAVKGEEYLLSTFCGKQLEFHSQGFFQNNTVVAEQMVHYVKTLIAEHNATQRTLIDAYGGVGTFGVVLADMCKEVISIESYPPGTESCKRNIARNNIQNMRAVNEDAGNMKKLALPADAIYLLDPPRSGLGEKMLRYLLEYKPTTIIYVSCNPTELSKELVSLSKYYTVQNVALFDMFPQTNHIECIVTLEKKN
jgi:23S rRNA (uracil-5-)-methyltransferase RumA